MSAIPLTRERTSSRVYLATLQVISFTLLQYVYIRFISDIYLYEGFYESFNSTKFYTSLVTIFVFSLIVPNRRNLVSFQLHVTIAIAISPMFALYAGMNLENWFFITSVIGFIITLASSTISIPTPTAKGIPATKIPLILISLTFILLILLYSFGAFQTINFDFNRVYELRRTIASDLPAAFGYLTPLFSKSFIPIGIVFAAYLRRYTYIAILVIVSFILFGLTTHKGIIFYPLVTMFVYILFERYNAEKAFLLAITAIPLIAIIDFTLYNSGTSEAWAGSLLTRRALILPALHHYYYMEFFSQNPWYWWSQSKLSLGLTHMPYDSTAPFVIGLEYYENSDTSANTGWIGSGYANAGMFGVIVYAVLMGLLFSLVESFGKKFGPSLAMGVFITPIIDILTSADITTLLLTHGLAASIVIMMMTRPIYPAIDSR